MNPQQAVSDYYSRYVDFQSRTSRPGFWWVFLYQLVVYVIIAALSAVSAGLGAVLITLWGLAHIVPSIAITVRRLHDSGKTGWLALIWFVPFVGWLIVLVMMVLPGDDGTNNWGDKPA